jgi:predicted HicB family RNase H-like nuclease
MAEHFTYRVSWSEEDREHVGTCSEFPSLSHLAADPVDALQGIRQLVADVVADMRANDEPVPQPIAETRYSGKFMVRIPPELHRVLAFEAAEEKISLNRLVSFRLSRPDMINVGRPLEKNIGPSALIREIAPASTNDLVLARASRSSGGKRKGTSGAPKKQVRK